MFEFSWVRKGCANILISSTSGIMAVSVFFSKKNFQNFFIFGKNTLTAIIPEADAD